MVFCYKTITESPRRSPMRSPRRRKTRHALTAEITALENDIGMDLGSIPERELRLLAALAKKRKEEDERAKLADEFHRLWRQEKESKDIMEAETALLYKRFIDKKREDEKLWIEHRRMLRTLEQHLQQGQLRDNIKRKEQKTEELLARRENKKATELVNRALEEDARAFLAAERRSLQESAADWRKRIELEEAKRRADHAERKREEILRDASKRIAITTTLNHWESALLRKEIEACDAARRAEYSMLATLAEQRGERVARARDLKMRRARAMAKKCEIWREALRAGWN